MNRKLVVFATFVTLCAADLASRVLAAPSEAALLAQAEKRYARISRELPRYRVVKRALRESAEGGELVAYFDGKILRRIVANNFGETGRSREEFSFHTGALFFARRTEERYAEPIGFDQPTTPNGTVARRTDERFYFANGKLFRRALQIAERGKAPRASVSRGQAPTDNAAAREVLANARRYLQIAKSAPRDE